MRRIGTLAAVSAFAFTSCTSGHHAKSRGDQANLVRTPVIYGTEATSPDGRRVVVVTHDGTAIKVGPTGGQGPWRTIYRSRVYTLTTDLDWATGDLIAFGDSNIEVNTINVRTRRVHRRLATANSFNVSSDGRWIAWSFSGGEFAPEHGIGVVSITGRDCLLPPGRGGSDSLAFFKPGVKRLFFLREPKGSVASGHIVSVPLSSLRRAPSSACQQ